MEACRSTRRWTAVYRGKRHGESVPRRIQPAAEGKLPGERTLYGLENFNHAGLSVRNAEMYQWNIGVQRQLPWNMLVEVNYSANRSTHMPWDKSLRSRELRERPGSRGMRSERSVDLRHGVSERAGSQSIPVSVRAATRPAGASLQRADIGIYRRHDSSRVHSAAVSAVRRALRLYSLCCRVLLQRAAGQVRETPRARVHFHRQLPMPT